MDQPTLHDPRWLDFNLAKEANSRLARKSWPRYREGLRRLAAVHGRSVPMRWLKLALAEDAFFCAAHWKHSPRIVHKALQELLRERPDPKVYAFAAAEYWKWASRVSKKDLNQATKMIDAARTRIADLDELSRLNVERMLVAEVEGKSTGTDTTPRPK
jgi:hypothetical protein